VDRERLVGACPAQIGVLEDPVATPAVASLEDDDPL
jgi:hypothetical protein